MLFVAFPLLLLIFAFCVWFSLVWLLCVLGHFTLGLSFWDSLGFLDLCGYFLPHFRKVFNYYLKYFLIPFLFVPSGTPMIWMLGHLTFFFSFFPLCFIYFCHSIFHLTYPIFCLSYSCIFSILISSLFICSSTLFSRFWSSLLSLFWILFQVDFLSPPLLFKFGGHLSCSFTCWIFLCLFTLFGLLCLGCP